MVQLAENAFLPPSLSLSLSLSLRGRWRPIRFNRRSPPISSSKKKGPRKTKQHVTRGMNSNRPKDDADTCCPRRTTGQKKGRPTVPIAPTRHMDRRKMIVCSEQSSPRTKTQRRVPCLEQTHNTIGTSALRIQKTQTLEAGSYEPHKIHSCAVIA